MITGPRERGHGAERGCRATAPGPWFLNELMVGLQGPQGQRFFVSPVSSAPSTPPCPIAPSPTQPLAWQVAHSYPQLPGTEWHQQIPSESSKPVPGFILLGGPKG